MKFKFILFSILFLNHQIKACDICGSGIAGSNINGIIPQLNKNVFGLRFSHNSFEHPNTPDNYVGSNRVLKDRYLNFDAWFRYYPSKRIQTVYILPFKSITRKQSDFNNTINGLGDASIMVNYAVLKLNDSGTQKFMWWIGTGTKIPTGKFQQRNSDKTMYPIGLQTGNGAYAMYLNNQITYKKNKLILNTVSQYMINAKNELDYQMGNVLSCNLQVLYQIRTGCDSYVLPHFSIEYVRSGKDISYGMINTQSGSKTGSVNVGIDWFGNSFFGSFTIKRPQQFNTYYSQPLQQINGNVNIGYIFN
jgi:hypothetical protein